MTVAEYVAARRKILGLSRYAIAKLVCQRLGLEPTPGRISGFTRKIGLIETGDNKLGHGAARPFATALGQVIDAEPLRLLRVCGLLPADEPVRPSPRMFFASDQRLTDYQRKQIGVLLESFGVDPDQPAP